MKRFALISVLVSLFGCAGMDDDPTMDSVVMPDTGPMETDAGAAPKPDTGTGVCMAPADWPTCPEGTESAIPYPCSGDHYCAECYAGSASTSPRVTGCVLAAPTFYVLKTRQTLQGPFFCVDGKLSAPVGLPGCAP